MASIYHQELIKCINESNGLEFLRQRRSEDDGGSDLFLLHSGVFGPDCVQTSVGTRQKLRSGGLGPFV